MKSCFNNLFKVLLIGLLIFSFAPVDSFSQKWVSTTPQKRNVLLEEFTGIHCVYCPDGHKIANELKNAYPGKVVVVNVHAGGYATPGTGELDLRTSIGTTIDRAASVSGYPSGTVNRATNPWGLSRNQWASVASQIMNMDSPVNVAVRSEYDPVLMKIKTEVEVYYTGNPQPGDKLNVVFLQDSILGSQTGGTQFYPSNFKNGQYIHNHVLRMSMDGNAWGLNLKNAEKGKLITKTFITEIPSIIGNVVPDMEQFRVVAYVAPVNNSGVYTATESKVTSGIIDTKNLVDISIIDKTVYPTNLKAIEITPQVEVTNNSDKEITSFDVYLELNGVSYPQTFTGSLKAGEKTIVSWPSKFSDRTIAQLNFKGVYDISNGLIDGTKNAINEVYKAFLQFKDNAFSTTTIGFDAALQNYVYIDQSQNPAFLPQADATLRFGANNTIGGLWYILDPAKIGGSVNGRPGYVMFGGCDLTGKQKAELSYFYAYSDGKLGGTAPVVRTEVSTDWGVTWTVLNTTTCTQTGEITPGYQYYLPKSAEYIPVKVDLSNYANQKFMLRVGAVPGTTGNCMWLDEISVTSSAVAQGPKISASTNSLAFGTVDTDKSKDMEVVITNSGDEQLVISSITKIDPNGVFTIVSGGSQGVIMPGMNKTITVKFQPANGGVFNGSIEIASNATNGASTTVNLSGTGNPAGSVAYGTTLDGSLSMTLTPNPVIGEAQFNYTINNDNSNVRIFVMDITGKVLSELVNSNLNSGTYNMNFSADKYVSGSYFIMAEINGQQAQIPVIIAK